MTEEQIIAKYGKPGDNIVMMELPFTMKLAWDPQIKIKHFRCHKSIRPNLEVIFEEVKAYYGITCIRDFNLDLFGGCFEIRPKKGGTKLSLHSWGLAVDIDPIRNQLKFTKEQAQLARPEYNTFWTIIEKHGGFSLGRLKNYDWMHFQFIKP